MCDTMGKLFSNGTAFFGKNSDRSPNEPQILYYYPAATHSEKTVMTTYIEVEQVPETKAIVLSRPSWLWGSEMGVNECGVCIGNEAVFTKGKYGKTGLTGMDMLRLALERSETAKAAVDCLIELLERYGQGGNCGYDHNFYYDNGFLIMDGKEIYILETAGKEWVYKKTSCAAISNRLSIKTDGDIYSSGKYDFTKKHLEPVYSFFSQSANRKSMCSSAIETATCLEDIFAALRQHNHEKNPLCTASVGSPCMHYGGLVGDHTTQSLVVEWNTKGEMILWTTGRSMPCISLFKPFSFGNIVPPVFEANDKMAASYWLEAELFNRNLLGHKLPAEYYTERDQLEAKWIQSSRNADTSSLQKLSQSVLEEEIIFINKWKNANLEKGTTSNLFRKNWENKNIVFDKIARVTKMEIYLDILQEAFQTKPSAIAENATLQNMLDKLALYYETEWRSDYESDERGELPPGLKRGVLSEDAIYNLLLDIKETGLSN